jgi:hypothetical protein
MALTFSVPDTELSLTLHNRRPQIIDNIFEKAVFLGMLRAHGGVEMADGGLQLVTPLRMSKNSTAGSYTDYDILDTTPQDNETSAAWDWAGEYATVSISGMEEARNSGRHALLSLLQTKITDAGDSIRDKLNVHLMQAQPSAGSKDPVSITELIDEAPTANPPRGATPLGGLAASNTWWRNQATDGGAFTVADMNSVYNDTSQASDFPNFLITSQTVFQYYENSQTGLVRYARTDTADLGFDALAYKSKPLVFDPQIGNTDEIYYINTDFLKLRVHRNRDFITTDFIEPDNQDAKVAKILWMGQLECTNRRRVGTLHGITAPA